MSEPEVWLRGAVAGYPPLLMPVAHALLQSREEIERLVGSVPPDHVWRRPGGAASVGFHIVHAGRSMDRLTTYARGQMLSDAQLRELRAEAGLEQEGPPMAAIAATTVGIIDRTLAQLRETPSEILLDARQVGRQGLPSTVIGLLVHVAEHTTRHIGQAQTTARILRGTLA